LRCHDRDNRILKMSVLCSELNSEHSTTPRVSSKVA
jgi:hypothetical protein